DGPYEMVNLIDMDSAQRENFAKAEPKAIYHNLGDWPDRPTHAWIRKINPCGQYSSVSLFLAVYRVTRHYGGPQEGGWWYDAGEVVKSIDFEVQFSDNGPKLSESELIRLKQISENLSSEYDFWTHHRNSMAPRGNDYTWSISDHEPEDWSGYQPWC